MSADTIITRAREDTDSSQQTEGVRGIVAGPPRNGTSMLASESYTAENLGVSASTTEVSGGSS